MIYRTALAVIAVLVIITLALLQARFRLKNESEARLRAQAQSLTEALARVQTLKGLLPIYPDRVEPRPALQT